MGKTSLGAQVGRTQIEPKLLLEVLDRRLVDARTRGEAPDQVDEPAERRARLGRPERHHLPDRVPIEQIGVDQLEPLPLRDPLEL